MGDPCQLLAFQQLLVLDFGADEELHFLKDVHCLALELIIAFAFGGFVGEAWPYWI